MLVQWTGSSRQAVSVPWTRIASIEDVEALAAAIVASQRHWAIYSTAIGEALEFTAAQFADVAECQRRVIDVSGDGPSNEGVDPRDVRAGLIAQDITVNALVIEESLQGLRDYFRDSVIAGPGAFVVIANSFRDYPERMREKLRRETERQLSLMMDQ
jgi:Ca-activated chloride channel family protein